MQNSNKISQLIVFMGAISLLNFPAFLLVSKPSIVNASYVTQADLYEDYHEQDEPDEPPTTAEERKQQRKREKEQRERWKKEEARLKKEKAYQKYLENHPMERFAWNIWNNKGWIALAVVIIWFFK